MTTVTRPRRGKSKPNPNDEIRAGVEIAILSIDTDAPDYLTFLARWSDRYGEKNLARLWVQCPHATVLHFHTTWESMGRHVKSGSKAIWLYQPRSHLDAEKISPTNPEGKVFTGARPMALFDYSQTEPLDPNGNYSESADLPNVNADTLAEIKRLKDVALSLHPDTLGVDETEDIRVAFRNAWMAYERARDAASPKER